MTVLLVRVVYTAFIFLLFSATTGRATVVLHVDQAGNGDYRRIQDAIDAVPANNSKHVLIVIKPGVYQERVVVPSNKPFVTLSGTSKRHKTIITWNAFGDIFSSPTVTIFASDFIGRYLTILNTHGAGAKAVALRVSGDKASFYWCRIQSHQDTLLDEKGRHYYRNCYIEGDTDFICGNAASVFKKCHLHSLSQGNGAVTAQQRQSPEEQTGFIFVGGKVSGSSNSAVLGRPWGTYSRVVFAFTYMSSVINPEGWDDWGNSSRQTTAFYGEYKCKGAGASSSNRVNWSHSLTSDEAEPYLSWGAIGGQSWVRSAIARLRKISSKIS
ncbi:OLC1v1018002C1 [Oldenlandia corymbosa var. corymbosa]|uniref:Pectinesterase n=1 Tax=Oldenlandia corymbosa var. corymbosa TaxID=529605 RepID=A0AAV1EAL9_OLDCO|nr:OLC1v1018002C1 [Oldenlandia corymbosa var. corymbosa]